MLDKRDQDQHGKTQQLLERLAERVTETERLLYEREMSSQGTSIPLSLRWPSQDRPSLASPTPPAENPPTLAGQLLRRIITQSEYDTSLENMTPLTEETEKNQKVERKTREKYLLEMIYVRRKAVTEAVLEAKSKSPNEIESGRDRKIDYQASESPRRKREQSHNSKNKRRQTEETSQQLSDITFSDGSTHPPETGQAQESTDRLMLEIHNGELARTRQKQAEEAHNSEEEDAIIGVDTIVDMFTPEEEIIFAIPTPGEMTDADLERNEMDISPPSQEDQPQQGEDPTSQLGKKP